MNARMYFETVVLPAFERFKKEPDALDLQFAAIIIVFHTADYINEDRGLNDISQVRYQITQQAPEFEAIFAAAHANKHKIVRTSPAAQKGLTDPQVVAPVSLEWKGEPIEWKGVPLAFGEAPHIELVDGRLFHLQESLQNVIRVLDIETALP